MAANQEAGVAASAPQSLSHPLAANQETKAAVSAPPACRAFDYETPAMRDEIKAKAAAAAVEEVAEEGESEDAAGEEQEGGDEGGSERQGGAAALEEEGEEEEEKEQARRRRQSGGRVDRSGAREPATVDEGLLHLGSQGQEPAAAEQVRWLSDQACPSHMQRRCAPRQLCDKQTTGGAARALPAMLCMGPVRHAGDQLQDWLHSRPSVQK